MCLYVSLFLSPQRLTSCGSITSKNSCIIALQLFFLLHLPMQYTLKKSLGQHFLKDENILQKIRDEVAGQLKITGVTHLAEVGPGAGALTKYLLQLGDINFKAIEIDAEKVSYLQHTYPAAKDKIIHSDFLESAIPFAEPFMVVGNFPYNISSQILFKILDWKEEVACMIGMFQKEVAERICSGPGKKAYGILSVLVQAFYHVHYLFDVEPRSFNPPPKVMSGVIDFIRKDDVPEMKSEAAFFRLVKTAFNQRRKMLRNAVKALFDETTLQNDIFSKRAEQLSVQDFAKLSFEMK